MIFTTFRMYKIHITRNIIVYPLKNEKQWFPMVLKQVMEVFELLDSPSIDGKQVARYLKRNGSPHVKTATVRGKKGSTDFINIMFPGRKGKSTGGDAPSLGIIGRLGGIGARPDLVGLVSDADGAISALACALKLAHMRKKRDVLTGDVYISTHICPNAPTLFHHPVPFMGSPVDMATMNRYEVDNNMDAVLSIDTTRGNRVAKFQGFAITPTVMQGYILRVSEDLLDTYERVTGGIPRVVPITTQDVTPYDNNLYHINSIMQPSSATDSPVVGVALTSESVVPGSATGATQLRDMEMATRFCIEVAKGYGNSKIRFYDFDEFTKLLELYGSMKHLFERIH